MPELFSTEVCVPTVSNATSVANSSGVGNAETLADTQYASSFRRYTDKTDGKKKLARLLLQYAAGNTSRGRLLDCGAGDGDLTSRLAPEFGEVIAVDKNDRFMEDLQRIRNCKAFCARMEDFDPPGEFDIILVSYAMMGIPAHRLREFLHRMTGKLSARGQLLACTFDDDCPWARFATNVHEVLGSHLRGGVVDHQARVQDAGYRAVLEQSIDTNIWDDDSDNLTHTMKFFFLKDHVRYLERFPAIKRQVERFSARNQDLSRREMTVRECILKISP
jgi:trans-aconitate methyltransferase